MQSYSRAVRLALVIGLSGSLAACGWVDKLKAQQAFKDANAAYKAQDFKKAVEHYERAVALNPDLTSALFYLANSYDNLYKPARAGEAENDAFLKKALEVYQQSYEKDPSPQIKSLALKYMFSAYSAERLNQPEQAEPLIKKMIDLDPKDTANYFALAKLYEDGGRYDEAEAALLKAKEMAPQSPDVFMQLAGFYNRQGDFEKTIEALNQRTAIEATNPEAFYTVSTFFWDKAYRDFRINDQQKAEYAKRGLEAADKAVALNPNYMEAVTYRGLLLRVLASVEKDAGQQKALLKDAEEMQQRALEIRKQRAAGITQ
jgi:tetratricopeptide (TPR) repeat protein